MRKQYDVDKRDYDSIENMKTMVGFTPSQQTSYANEFNRGWLKGRNATWNNNIHIPSRANTIKRMGFKAGYIAGMNAGNNVTAHDSHVNHVRADRDARFTPSQREAYERLGLI